MVTFISSLFLSGLTSNDIPTDIEKVNLKIKEDQLAFTFLSLSSGEATLIQNSRGDNILINTGGPKTEGELKELLTLYDINSFHSVILTKNDNEYKANIEYLSKNYLIGKTIVGEHLTDSKIRTTNNLITWKSGDKLELLPGLTVEVIQENEDASGSLGMDLLLSFGKHELLYMTSSNTELEKNIILKRDLSSVNIIKVPEFASNTGTSQKFLEHIDPQVAVIFQKRGLNVSQDVIERLQETWIDIYHTRQFGNITIKCDEEDYDIITLSVESANQI